MKNKEFAAAKKLDRSFAFAISKGSLSQAIMLGFPPCGAGQPFCLCVFPTIHRKNGRDMELRDDQGASLRSRPRPLFYIWPSGRPKDKFGLGTDRVYP